MVFNGNKNDNNGEIRNKLNGILEGRNVDVFYGAGIRTISFNDGTKRSIRNFKDRIDAYVKVCEENNFFVDYKAISNSILKNKYLDKNRFKKTELIGILEKYAIEDENLDIMPAVKKNVLEGVASAFDKCGVNGFNGVAGRYNSMALSYNGWEIHNTGTARIANKYGVVGFDDVDDPVINLVDIIPDKNPSEWEKKGKEAIKKKWENNFNNNLWNKIVAEFNYKFGRSNTTMA